MLFNLVSFLGKSSRPQGGQQFHRLREGVLPVETGFIKVVKQSCCPTVCVCNLINPSKIYIISSHQRVLFTPAAVFDMFAQTLRDQTTSHHQLSFLQTMLVFFRVLGVCHPGSHVYLEPYKNQSPDLKLASVLSSITVNVLLRQNIYVTLGSSKLLFQ